MADIINGYLLEEPLKTDNSGFSKWGFAKKDEKEYFIKEFLNPVYPTDVNLLGQELTQMKQEKCKAFVSQKCQLFRAVNEASDGNLVRIEHFFRYGSKYYLVMDKVEAVALDQVMHLTIEEKIRICMILAHAVDCLHRASLVHSDIKLDNVLFCQTGNGKIGVKVIDLDSCFWESRPPHREEDIIGDQIYMAPETFQLIVEEKGTLTRKIDVFALGILFHQILTGELPGYSKEVYHYPYEAVLERGELKLACGGTPELAALLRSMLRQQPEDRPELDEVCTRLQALYWRLLGILEEDSSGPDGKEQMRERKDEFFFQASEDDL